MWLSFYGQYPGAKFRNKRRRGSHYLKLAATLWRLHTHYLGEWEKKATNHLHFVVVFLKHLWNCLHLVMTLDLKMPLLWAVLRLNVPLCERVRAWIIVLNTQDRPNWSEILCAWNWLNIFCKLCFLCVRVRVCKMPTREEHEHYQWYCVYDVSGAKLRYFNFTSAPCCAQSTTSIPGD